MICRIHEEKYFSFAADLKAEIEQKIGGFLGIVADFLEEFPTYNKNFDVYIRQADSKNPYRKEYYFMLELDSHSLLDVYGQVNSQTGVISELYFRATIPYHESWKGQQFERLPLNEVLREELLQLQDAFSKDLHKIGVSMVMDIDAFNPEPDSLPEAVVNLEPRETDFSAFIEGSSVLPFLATYYEYVLKMNQCFEKRKSNN